jgi:hypothetical protein
LGKEGDLKLLDEWEGKGAQYLGFDAWPGRGGGGIVPIAVAKELFTKTP